MRTLYQILGIPNNATQEDIIAAYRNKVIENHPDKGGNAIEFMNIRKAYKTLSNPAVRSRYDQWLTKKTSETNRQRWLIFMKSFIMDTCNNEKLSLLIYSYLESDNNIDIYSNLSNSPQSIIAARLVKECLHKIVNNHPELFRQCVELDSVCNDIILGKTSYTYESSKECATSNGKSNHMDIPETGSPLLKTTTIIVAIFLIAGILLFFTYPQKADICHNNIDMAGSEDNSTENADSGVQSNYQDYYVTNFDTGAIPYEDYFGYGQFDDKSLSELTITNYSSTDAVVLLETLDGDVIRNNFINTGDVFTMKQIPSCTCKIKVMFGKSWNSKKNNGHDSPSGGFMDDVSFMEADDIFFFNALIEDKRIKYPTYSITLHKVENGNMQTTPISQDSFFN